MGAEVRAQSQWVSGLSKHAREQSWLTDSSSTEYFVWVVGRVSHDASTRITVSGNPWGLVHVPVKAR